MNKGKEFSGRERATIEIPSFISSMMPTPLLLFVLPFFFDFLRFFAPTAMMKPTPVADDKEINSRREGHVFVGLLVFGGADIFDKNLQLV